MERYLILFVLFTNIKTGAGTEKSLYNYLKYADTSKFDITVLQTNRIQGGQRLNDSDLDLIKDKVNFIETEDYISPYKFINSKYFKYLFDFFGLYVLFKILRFVKYKKIINLDVYDVVYLFDNYYSYLFSRKSIVIGSNHCAFDDPNSFKQKLSARLISLNMLFPSISAFHLFPQNISLERYLGRTPLIKLSNGVNPDLYFPQNNHNLKTKILFVGRLEKNKGVLMVLKIYESINKIFQAELIIVGSGSLEEEVDKACIDDNSIKHFKNLRENDLANIYRSCDILLNPTTFDTYSLVVLEALSSGLKVVTTNLLYNVYSDFIKFDVIRFANFDEKQLIEALIDIKDKNIDQNVIHDYIEKNYSWKVVSERLFDSMNNICIKKKIKKLHSGS